MKALRRDFRELFSSVFYITGVLFWLLMGAAMVFNVLSLAGVLD